MATIGTFTKTNEGFSGEIRTLALSCDARIEHVAEKDNPKAPDYRIYAGEAELGAAWEKQVKDEDGRTFLRVKLDDPSFPQPIFATLTQRCGDDAYVLVWSRSVSSH